MVETTQAYHPKVFNTIRCLTGYYAREEAKHQIRARGEKVSDYLPKLLLVTRPQEFVDRAKASAIVKKVQAEPSRGRPGRRSHAR